MTRLPKPANGPANDTVPEWTARTGLPSLEAISMPLAAAGSSVAVTRRPKRPVTLPETGQRSAPRAGPVGPRVSAWCGNRGRWRIRGRGCIGGGDPASLLLLVEPARPAVHRPAARSGRAASRSRVSRAARSATALSAAACARRASASRARRASSSASSFARSWPSACASRDVRRYVPR